MKLTIIPSTAKMCYDITVKLPSGKLLTEGFAGESKKDCLSNFKQSCSGHLP